MYGVSAWSFFASELAKSDPYGRESIIGKDEFGMVDKGIMCHSILAIKVLSQVRIAILSVQL